MAKITTKQGVLFKGLSKKVIVAQFDQDYASSDGGAILLKACDEKLDLSAALASCLQDDRQQGKVMHSLQEMFRQRMFSIACGYVDTNDAARLAGDPIFKLLSDRDAIDGDDLASQPTLSRFENRVSRKALLRMSETLAETVIKRHKRRKKKAQIRIRLDSGFTGPALYEFFEAEGLEYVVGMATNSVLKGLAEPIMEEVRKDFDKNPGAAPRYRKCWYAAGSWKRKRHVVIKGVITSHPGREPKENQRYVITNIKGSAKYIYEHIYCARGDAENRIKELKLGLQIDRTSCTSFLANQLRVLMTAAAYILFQELRIHARHTRCAQAQVDTLRLYLLKFGAWVESSVRRIMLHLPSSTPYADDWRRIARSVGAIPT